MRLSDVQILRKEIYELVVPASLQNQMPTVIAELNLPSTFLERMAHDLWKILGSLNTKVQEKLSLNSLIRILEKEKSLEQHLHHKYATSWDLEKQLTFLGIGQIKVGEIFEIPYPQIGFSKLDPIKRNFKLAMKLLRSKSDLHPKHFWVPSVHKSYKQSKEDTLGTICLFDGILCEPLKYDAVSKTYITTLTESVYNFDSHMQIKLILDADTDTTAFYFTPLEDLFNYEYVVVGVIIDYNNQPAVRCYGLIAIDEPPEVIKKIWGIDKIGTKGIAI